MLTMEQSDEKTWTLPNPPVIHDRLDPSGGLREYLEDVEMELSALTSKTAAEMNIANPLAGEGWPSAQRELERILTMQGCKFTARTHCSPSDLDVWRWHAACSDVVARASGLKPLCACRDTLRTPLTEACRSQVDTFASDKHKQRS